MIKDRLRALHRSVLRAPLIRSQSPERELPERRIDLVLLAAVLILVVIGTLEIYSSSAVYALKKHGDSTYFLKRQLAWLTLGFGTLYVGANMDYRWLHRYTYPLLGLSLFLLVTVLIFGKTINSAKRWFIIGPISFQPVELAKLALITYLAYSLARKQDKVKSFTIGFVPHLVVCALMMALLLKQPDLGSSIILGATTLFLLFISGAKVSYILLAVLAAAPIAYQFIVGTSWRMQRLMAFFNPEAYSQGVAYQVVQSRIAVGSGGWGGMGLGEGRSALGYMPEAHNDFIMSAVGEELGFVGFFLVMVLFAVIAWRGVRAALGAREAFGAYLAMGITVVFALQALVHSGVVLGALPAKGITLPFVSYGGSSLLAAMFFAGVLMNISKRAKANLPGSEPVTETGAVRRKERVIIKVA